MAIEPKDEYPAQTIDSDPDYPHGKARNVTVPGDGTGTPLEQRWVNDLWGFLQRLLTLAGITPSGVPDNASASDYYDALVALFVGGPSSATDNRVARFDGTTGKQIQSSPVTIDDSGNTSGVEDLEVGGDLTVGGTVEYETPQPKIKVISLASFWSPEDPMAPQFTSNRLRSLSTTAIGQKYFAPIDLPDGSVITRVDVLGAWAGGDDLYVEKHTPNFSTPTLADSVLLGSDTTVAGTSLLSVTGLSETVNNETTSYHISLNSTGSFLGGARVHYNQTKIE